MKKFFKSFLSLNPTSITTGLIIVVLVLFFVGVSIFDIIELKTYDLRFLSRGVKKPTSDVVLAVIDEKSLDTVGLTDLNVSINTNAPIAYAIIAATVLFYGFWIWNRHQKRK